ncbi:MAG: hypothetical protein ABI591_17645 [Kofleriaceae bacterium]
MSEEDPPGSFGHGMAVGVAISAVLVHIAFVALGGDWQKLYADFQAPVPLMTRITISIPWQLGVPVVGSVLIGALILKRPRGLAAYATVAMLLVLACGFTIVFPSAPLTALANTIK